MAKRKLTHQQKSRISKAQEMVLDDLDGTEALVISHHGGQLLLELDNGDTVDALIKSNLGHIVSGDKVIAEKNKNGEYRVLAIQQRTSFLQRQDGFGHHKAVAANITQLVICCAVKPEPNLLLLDQYLLSAEQLGIKALILINKADLLNASENDPFSLWGIYQAIGYRLINLSVESKQGMPSLLQALDNHRSVICGVSGVGKSSIIQSILPQEAIKIGAISESNEEGKHTTRTSRLYHLPAGGDLIDTPGVRGFTPHLDRSQAVYLGFPEIAESAQSCKFANCKHINEPGCAVISALTKNTIAQSRYDNYLKLAY